MSTEVWDEKSSLGERIRAERERLALSQESLGAIFGVDRKVIRNYEGNKTSPRADQLIEFARAGADAVYILLGIRTPLIAIQERSAYSPAQRLAGVIATLTLSDEDSAMLEGIARRLAVVR